MEESTITNLFKDKHPPIPKDVEMNADLGYQGIDKDFPSLKSRIIEIKNPDKAKEE